MLIAILLMIIAVALVMLGTKEERVTQTCFIYCPNCKNELIGTNGYIGMQDDLEMFGCNECGTVSSWDFGHPTPLLIRE